jgi:hypothetical protein
MIMGCSDSARQSSVILRHMLSAFLRNILSFPPIEGTPEPGVPRAFDISKASFAASSRCLYTSTGKSGLDFPSAT